MDKIASYKELIYKVAQDRSKDTETKLMRDRVAPEISRKARRFPAELATDLTIGALAGKYGAKLGGKVGKAINSNKSVRRASSKLISKVKDVPNVSKVVSKADGTINKATSKLKNHPTKQVRELGDKVDEFKNSNKKTESIGKVIGGGVAATGAVAPVKYHLRNKQEEKDYDKLSNKYLGRSMNSSEKKAINSRNKKIALGTALPFEDVRSTPEAMIQKARREKR